MNQRDLMNRDEDWSFLSDLIRQMEAHCARLKLLGPRCQPEKPFEQMILTFQLIDTCEVFVEEVRRLGLVKSPVVKPASGPIEGSKQT
jgi:hypothetical protein